MKRAGNCYENSYKALEDMGQFGFVLCHGVCLGWGGEIKGKRYGHAWIENENCVIDNGRAWSKGLYYSLVDPQHVKRFTLREMYKEALEHEHFGPWNLAIELTESLLDIED